MCTPLLFNVAESTFPLPTSRSAKGKLRNEREHGAKMESIADAITLCVEMPFDAIETAELSQSLFKHTLEFFSQRQIVWNGHRVVIECRSMKTRRPSKFKCYVTKVNCFTQNINSGQYVWTQPGRTKIMIESLIKQGAQSTQHATFSKCSRARCEFVKPDFIHNIELKCYDTREHIMLMNVPRHLKLWLKREVQKQRFTDVLEISCRYLKLLNSDTKIQAIVHEQILSTRRAKNTMLLLSDIDALNDKSVISVLNSVRDVCDFDIHASKGFQRVKILSTGSGQTQRPRFQRLFSHRQATSRRGESRNVGKSFEHIAHQIWSTTQRRLLITGLADIAENLQSYQGMKIRKVNTGWDDIGGLEDVKRTLFDMIDYPLRYPKLYCRQRTRRGALLCGPPGTGKTLVAKAASEELKLQFLNIKGPELLSMYVGESERCIREIFSRARELSPTLIFFDEIDSLAAVRSDSVGLMNRVVSQLITELDSTKNSRVFVLAASNRPELVDPGLLRPGRLDCVLRVPGFTTTEAKIGVFKAITRKFMFETGSVMLGVDKFVASLPIESGAQMYAVCVAAWLKAVKRHLEKQEKCSEIALRECVLVSAKDFC